MNADDPDFEADLPTGAYQAVPAEQPNDGDPPALDPDDPRLAATIPSGPPRPPEPDDRATVTTVGSAPAAEDVRASQLPTGVFPAPTLDLPGAATVTTVGAAARPDTQDTFESNTAVAAPRRSFDVASAPTLLPGPKPPRSGGGFGVWVLSLACLIGIGAFAVRLWREQVKRDQPSLATVTYPGSGDWFSGDVRIRGNVPELTDVRLELAGQAITLGGQPEFEFLLGDLGDGEHVLDLKVSGLRGATRVESNQEIVVRVDRTPPEVVVASPSEDGVLATPPRLTLRVRDTSGVQLNLRGAARLNYAVDPAPGWSQVVLPLELAPGPHEIQLTAMDEAGHSVSLVRRFRVAPADDPPPPTPPAVPPVIAFGFASGALFGPGPLPIQVEHAEQLQVLVDKQPLAAPYALPAELSDGSHELKIRAVSGLFEVTRTTTFEFDGQPPSLELTLPKTASSPLTLTGTLHDADPQAWVELSVDGGAPQRVTFPHTLPLAPGARGLRFVTHDSAGNSATHSYSIGIKSAPVEPPEPPPTPDPPPPPKFEPASWVTLPTFSSTAVEITGTVPRGVRISLWIDGKPRAESARLPLLLTLAAGSHELEIRARSGTKDASIVARGTVTVSDAPPQIHDLRVVQLDGGKAQVTARLVLSGHGRVIQTLVVNGNSQPRGLPRIVTLRDGDNSFLLRVRDASGQQDEAIARLRYTPPVVEPPVRHLPGSWGTAELPTFSSTAVRVGGELNYSGLTVIVRERGVELGKSPTLPFYVKVETGEHVLEVVAVDGSERQKPLLKQTVQVSDGEPILRKLTLQNEGHNSVRIVTETIEQGRGRVKLTALHNGRTAAVNRPLVLFPGYNLVVGKLEDSAGRFDTKTRLVRYYPATRTNQGGIRPGGETGKVEEAQALSEFFSGNYRGALGTVDALLRHQSAAVDLRALRARIHLALANRLSGVQRSQELTRALDDAQKAILNASQRVRADHYELKAEILDIKGRPTEAAQARNKANLLR